MAVRMKEKGKIFLNSVDYQDKTAHDSIQAHLNNIRHEWLHSVNLLGEIHQHHQTAIICKI